MLKIVANNIGKVKNAKEMTDIFMIQIGTKEDIKGRQYNSCQDNNNIGHGDQSRWNLSKYAGYNYYSAQKCERDQAQGLTALRTFRGRGVTPPTSKLLTVAEKFVMEKHNNTFWPDLEMEPRTLSRQREQQGSQDKLELTDEFFHVGFKISNKICNGNHDVGLVARGQCCKINYYNQNVKVRIWSSHIDS